jgi:hypothetical protein
MHDLPPFSWTFAEPTGWGITREPGSHLFGELFDEQAVVHGPNSSGFYLRANLRLPVLDANENVSLTVWVSVSGADFERAHQLWDDPRRVTEPAYFARLCNRIPGYPDTWHLRAYVHTQPVGRRPVVELEPTEHPLVSDQKRGINLARVIEIAEAFEESMAQPLT